jgi:hypothetical protein
LIIRYVVLRISASFIVRAQCRLSNLIVEYVYRSSKSNSQMLYKNLPKKKSKENPPICRVTGVKQRR